MESSMFLLKSIENNWSPFPTRENELLIEPLPPCHRQVQPQQPPFAAAWHCPAGGKRLAPAVEAPLMGLLLVIMGLVGCLLFDSRFQHRGTKKQPWNSSWEFSTSTFCMTDVTAPRDSIQVARDSLKGSSAWFRQLHWGNEVCFGWFSAKFWTQYWLVARCRHESYRYACS